MFPKGGPGASSAGREPTEVKWSEKDELPGLSFIHSWLSGECIVVAIAMEWHGKVFAYLNTFGREWSKLDEAKCGQVKSKQKVQGKQASLGAVASQPGPKAQKRSLSIGTTLHEKALESRVQVLTVLFTGAGYGVLRTVRVIGSRCRYDPCCAHLISTSGPTMAQPFPLMAGQFYTSTRTCTLSSRVGDGKSSTREGQLPGLLNMWGKSIKAQTKNL
jgi:hypothetical protein